MAKETHVFAWGGGCRTCKDTLAFCLLALVFMYEWGSAGIHKLAGGTFVDGMEKTLTAFAANTTNGWYAQFLRTVGIPNATTFGTLVLAGELAVAAALLVCVCLLFQARTEKIARLGYALGALGFGVGAFMNANFYFAAGSSSASINIIMFCVEVVLCGVMISRSRSL